MELGIDDIIETLKGAKNKGRTCTLLIGAGVSQTAGIPTAAGLVDEIQKRYPLRYNAAKDKTYAACMARLAEGERRDLIAEFISQRKIHLAHLGIAQPIKAGHINPSCGVSKMVACKTGFQPVS